ncbi:MAG TPA: ankyrin repeat domain-containing protein [Polyangiaceae bacterium]|nr:ankyrin repeat domain-containing protein [Polyangiaceae bacterium]
MGWWQKLLGKSSRPESSDGVGSSPPQRDADVRWMSADEPGNPFGVPLLNLMSNLQLISTTQDPAMASRAVSWRAGQQDRLSWDVDGETIDCSLEYQLEAPLPDGMLFLPQAMEDKWVIAFKSGRIAGARSWSGETQWVANARQDGDKLHISQLTFAPEAGLALWGDAAEALHWVIETHVLGCRVPFPASAEGAEALRTKPLAAMSVFGHRLFCAAVAYAVPPSGKPIRSDGDLVAALWASDVPRIRDLLQAGHNLTTPSRSNGYRAIHLAVASKKLEVVRLLLERGADPNQTADQLARPLPLALVARCAEPILQSLVEAGADLEAPDAKQFRPLHAACEVGNVAGIRFLVARGVEREPRTVDGYTPLHIACALGHLEAAKTLVELGADVHATSKTGSAIDIARSENKPDVVTWLERLR